MDYGLRSKTDYLRTGAIPFFFSSSVTNIGIRWFERRDLPAILTICLACSLLLIFFPLYGIPEGYDVAQHLKFAAAYQQALFDGSIIPHWASSDNLGFGSPGIRFYPPIADLVLGATQIYTGDWYDTLLINSVFWIFPGCIGVYLWIRNLSTRLVAMSAGILYAAMPYHLLQIYQFQLFSEYVAAAVMPFCFLFATMIVKRNRWTDILGLSVSCSLLILTHIPSSLIGLSGLAVFCLVSLNWSDPKALVSTIKRLAIAGTLVFCCTSYYVVRMALELEWIKHNTAEYSTGFYYFGHHFFPLIFNYGEVYQQLNLWVIDIAIVFTILIVLPGTFALLLGRRSFYEVRLIRQIFVAIVVTALFSLFMVSSISSPVWILVAPLQKIQFPWRFMSVATLMGSALMPLSIQLLVCRFSWHKRLLLYPAVGLLFVIVLFDVTQNIMQSGPLDRDHFNEKVVFKPANDFCTCWWPTWAQKDALNNVFPVSAAGRSISVGKWDPLDRDIIVGQGDASSLQIPTFYYPRWKATVNDRLVDVGIATDGTIEVPISPEKSNVKLHFQEPLIITVTTYISGIGWSAVGLLLLAAGILQIRDSVRTRRAHLA